MFKTEYFAWLCHFWIYSCNTEYSVPKVIHLKLNARIFSQNLKKMWVYFVFKGNNFHTVTYNNCSNTYSFHRNWIITTFTSAKRWLKSWDSVSSIATGYGLDDQGVRIISSRHRPDRFWGPPGLLSNGYRGALSPGGKAAGA
jgi:hypothetical protein